MKIMFLTKKGIKYVINESTVDGETGLSFHFLKKDGNDEISTQMLNQCPNS